MKYRRLQHEKPNKKQKMRRGLLFVSVVLTAAALVTGFTMARYVHQWQSDPALADTQAFYFTSDLLKEASDKAEYYIDPQAGSIQIALSNAADTQRITAEAISYQVTADGGTIDGASTGSLAGGAANTAEIKVVPSASEITVTVTTSSPYEYTLTAKFIRAPGNYYTVEDQTGNTAAVLTLSCMDAGKDISLTLPEGVVPDATNAQIKKESGGGYVFHSPGPGVYSLVLLKSDSSMDLSKEKTPCADSISVGN